MSDVFISYSRKDIAFARLLHEALQEKEVETWIDWARIPVGEKWWDEICEAIEQASVFVFIISQNSVGSEVCKKEINQALSHNKRVIPVIVDDTSVAAIQEFVPDLTAINWIIFKQDDVFKIEERPDKKLKPEEQFAALPKEPKFLKAIEKLNTAIHTDWAWVKVHTRLETRALEWERRNQESSLLLRGKDLREAEDLLTQAGMKKDPQPTEKQKQYVQASHLVEMRRKQLTLAIVTMGVIAAAVMGYFIWNRSQAAKQANVVAQEEATHTDALRISDEADKLLKADVNNSELAALLTIRSLNQMYNAVADTTLISSMKNLGYTPIFHVGHTDTVTDISFSPDGKYLLSGSRDGTAILWDVETGSIIYILTGHNHVVNSVAFSPDGKKFATGSSDQTVKIWDITTGNEIYSFKLEGIVYRVVFSPDGQNLLASNNMNVSLLNLSTGTEILNFIGHTKFSTSVDISTDGRYVLTGSDDMTAILWDAETGEKIQTYSGFSDGITSVAISPDNVYALISSHDNTIVQFDINSGEKVRTFISQAVSSVDFSQDGILLAYNTITGAKVCDAASGTEILNIVETRNIESIVFSPDGKFIATGNLYGAITMWEISTGQKVNTYGGPSDIVSAEAISPDGKYILSGSNDDTLVLWNIETGTIIDKIVLQGSPSSVAFSPDMKYYFEVDGHDGLKIWETSSKSQVGLFPDIGLLSRSAAFSPDGKFLMLGNFESIELWDISSGSKVREFNDRIGLIQSIAFSPDGKFVVTGSSDKTAKLWEVSTLREIVTFTGHTDGVTSVAFSVDGKYVLTGSSDTTAKLWDVASGSEILTFNGHSERITDVEFSPDSDLLITISDKSAKLWSIETGENVRTFVLSGWSNIANFSPDGNNILISGGFTNRGIMLLDIDYRDTIVRACANLTRDLTAEERAQFGITDDAPTCPNFPTGQELKITPTQTVSHSLSEPTVTPTKATLEVTIPLGTLIPTQSDINTTWDNYLLDDFNSNINGWTLGSETSYGVNKVTFDNGELVWTFTVKKGGVFVKKPNITAVSDFDSSVDIKLGSGSITPMYGLTFRYVDNMNYSIFVINEVDQTFSVLEYKNGWQTLIDWTPSSAILPNQVNHLEIAARGSNFWFYINDKPVGTIENMDITLGQVGIASWITKPNEGDTSTLYFDNFELDFNN
jgi:WD40 repeat protein